MKFVPVNWDPNVLVNGPVGRVGVVVEFRPKKVFSGLTRFPKLPENGLFTPPGPKVELNWVLVRFASGVPFAPKNWPFSPLRRLLAWLPLPSRADWICGLRVPVLRNSCRPLPSPKAAVFSPFWNRLWKDWMF